MLAEVTWGLGRGRGLRTFVCDGFSVRAGGRQTRTDANQTNYSLTLTLTVEQAGLLGSGRTLTHNNTNNTTFVSIEIKR